MIIGKLKPIEWFLEIEVKSVPLDLQDINDKTEYKKPWFESLVVVEDN